MRPRIVISVDGLAGSGKSTLAHALAERLDFKHLNTGLLYRAVGMTALRGGADMDSGASVFALAKPHKYELVIRAHGSRVLVDGQDYTDSLASIEAGEAASKAGRHAEVRNLLVQIQREALPGLNMVAEGRDMGTVIFPDARVKFFVTAELEVRVDRRLAQLYPQARQPEYNLLKTKIRTAIAERDQTDSTRAVSPTIPAQGAVIIDNSYEPLTLVIQKMYDAALVAL